MSITRATAVVEGYGGSSHGGVRNIHRVHFRFRPCSPIGCRYLTMFYWPRWKSGQVVLLCFGLVTTDYRLHSRLWGCMPLYWPSLNIRLRGTKGPRVCWMARDICNGHVTRVCSFLCVFRGIINNVRGNSFFVLGWVIQTRVEEREWDHETRIGNYKIGDVSELNEVFKD